MRERRLRAAKKAASEENVRRKRLKNKTEKLFMREIRGKAGSKSRRLEKMKRDVASEQNLRRFKLEKLL